MEGGGGVTTMAMSPVECRGLAGVSSCGDEAARAAASSASASASSSAAASSAATAAARAVRRNCRFARPTSAAPVAALWRAAKTSFASRASRATSSNATPLRVARPGGCESTAAHHAAMLAHIARSDEQ